jgi:hypothetical protein
MVEALSFLMAPIVENKLSTVKCMLTTYILLGIMHHNASIDFGLIYIGSYTDPVIVTS